MAGTGQLVTFQNNVIREMFAGQPGGLIPVPPTPFQVGESQPWFRDAEDPTLVTDKNIGLPYGVEWSDLEMYPGASTGGGVITINQVNVPGNGILEGYNFGNNLLDIRADVDLETCAGVLLPSNVQNTDYYVRAMQGGSGTSHEVGIFNSEFHMRAQKDIPTLRGRNFNLYKSVFTGGSDTFGGVQGGIGSAPANFLLNAQACFFGYLGWWMINYTTFAQRHIDNVQSDGGSVPLAKTIFGSALFAWVSEYVGTGTPGSGNGSNPFAAVGSSAIYGQSQATMEARRATYLNQWSNAATSYEGVARVRGTAGVDTSQNGMMVNRAPVDLQKNWFSGGHGQINLADPSIANGAQLIVKDNRMWRDCGVHILGRAASAGFDYPYVSGNVNEIGQPISVYEP